MTTPTTEKHGERPNCEGVALPHELAAAEPIPYTPAYGRWLAELREFAASHDGGGVPINTIESVYPQRCPDCGIAVVIITTI